jgi:hypothetical protein
MTNHPNRSKQTAAMPRYRQAALQDGFYAAAYRAEDEPAEQIGTMP